MAMHCEWVPTTWIEPYSQRTWMCESDCPSTANASWVSPTNGRTRRSRPGYRAYPLGKAAAEAEAKAQEEADAKAEDEAQAKAREKKYNPADLV